MTERICEWCKEPFVPTHGNQKYCGDICRYESRKEYLRVKRIGYYHKWKTVKHEESLGTGWLSSTPKNSFDDEQCEIEKELKRLRIVH